jgi:hypothetical protein
VQVLAGQLSTAEAGQALAALGVQGFTGPAVQLGRPVAAAAEPALA